MKIKTGYELRVTGCGVGVARSAMHILLHAVYEYGTYLKRWKMENNGP